MDCRANVLMNKLQIKEPVIDNIAGDPGAPVEGQIWYDTVANQMKYRNDAANVPIIGGLSRFSSSLGDAVLTAFTVSHGLNTTLVVVQVIEAATGDVVYPAISVDDVDTVTVTFEVIPTTNQYTVCIIG